MGTYSLVDRAGNLVTHQQYPEIWRAIAESADSLIGLEAVDHFEDREDEIRERVGLGQHWPDVYHELVFAFAPIVAVYSKAFLENVAKRNADAAAEAASRMRRRWRFRKRHVHLNDRCEVRIDFSSPSVAAAIIVTENMPDEALLAMLELDVSSEAVRGKVLRWDDELMSWVPDANEE